MPPRRRTLREHFAARLAEARQRAGHSQRQLATKAGWALVAGGVRINRYELAKSEPDLAALEKLAHKLGVPPAYLVADSQEQADAFLAVTEDPDILRAIQAMRRMTPEQRAQWLGSLLALGESDSA